MSLTKADTIQAQQRKIADLERQLRETRFQLEESNAVQSEALQRHAEMQQELENNAGMSQPPEPEEIQVALGNFGVLQSAASSVYLAYLQKLAYCHLS